MRRHAQDLFFFIKNLGMQQGFINKTQKPKGKKIDKSEYIKVKKKF